MDLFDRAKKSARILIKGEPRKGQRGLIPALTPEEIAEVKQFFPREKFFIFGHARSGTTLLTRLVRLHPEVYCNYQAHFFTRRPLLKSLVNTPEAEEWLGRKSNRWNRGRDLSPVVLRVVADFIMERDAAREDKRIVGDKSPLSTIHGQAVRELHSIYPDAKLIYIVRDGRDVLISERFRNFVEESRFLTAGDRRTMEELRADPDAFAKRARSLFSPSFIQRVAGGWATDVLEVDTEGWRLFPDSFLTLRYEDLLQAPFEEISKVWRFLETTDISNSLEDDVRSEMNSNPDEEWQSRRNEDIASFLSKGTMGNWRSLFTDEDKVLFRQVAGDMLVKWGYEKDNSW